VAFVAAFKDRDRGRVILSVTQAEVNDAPATLGEETRAAVVQDDERLAGLFASDFQVLPAQLRTNAGPESFGDGFLRRKTRGEERAGIPVFQAVGDFGWAKDSLDKTVAEFLEGTANAIHLDDIDARAEDHPN